MGMNGRERAVEEGGGRKGKWNEREGRSWRGNGGGRGRRRGGNVRGWYARAERGLDGHRGRRRDTERVCENPGGREAERGNQKKLILPPAWSLVSHRGGLALPTTEWTVLRVVVLRVETSHPSAGFLVVWPSRSLA